MTDFFKKRKARKLLREMTLRATRRLVGDDDILSVREKESLRAIAEGARAASASGSLLEMNTFLSTHSGNLETLVDTHSFKAKMRGALDIAAVAFAVAFGIRALYFQPFQIPTGSMQPTLFGIHYVDKKALSENNSAFVSTMLALTSRRAEATVLEDGKLDPYYKPVNGFFSTASEFRIGNETYTLPGDFLRNVVRYARLEPEKEYRKGDRLADGYLSTGDHLFVERFSIHFVPPRRGDVIVFNTENIKSPTQVLGGYYYIKRLIGLPGDTIRIDENIVRIKPKGEKEFRPITDFSDNFKKVYSHEGGYQGHVPDGLLADENEIVVPENAYFAMGDNTSNSLDGRNWGFIPRRNMIGRALWVFWPLSRRWGIADMPERIHIKTELPSSMELQ